MLFRSLQTEGNMNLDSVINDIKKQIAILTEGLRVLEGLGGKQAGPRRKMTAAGRKKIAAAQRKRWAKIRAGK